MKKSVSLILAIVMVAAIMVSAIPFAAFAEEAEAAPICRIGTTETDDITFAAMLAGMATEDVTITLLTDIQLTAKLPLANDTINEATGKPVKITFDGNGHTITSNLGNMLTLGGSAAAPNTTHNVVLKDLSIEYSGVGSVIQVYAGGDFLFEDLFINCTAAITWVVINANMENNGKDNPANIAMNNVDIIQPQYGGNSKTGDTSFVRTGNSNGDYIGPVIYYTLKDCDFRLTPAAWSADHQLAASGIHVTHANGHFNLENCYIEGAYRTVNITSGVEGKVAEGDKLVVAKNCEFVNINGEGTKISHGYGDTEKTQPAEKSATVYYYCDKYATFEGTYAAPAGEALFIEEGAAAVDCATLADALAKAAASTKNSTVKIVKDLTLTSSIQVSTLNKDVVVTLDGGNNTLTLSAGNAIKVGADGVEAKINLKNFDIEYSTGAGSIIQVYANGEVNISDVKINNVAKLNWCAVNALNKSGTTLTMTIDDCVFVSEAEGNNANVGVVRTGNGGNIVNLTIKNSDIAAIGEGGEKPAAALNVTTDLATIVIEGSALRATNNSAILFSKEVATKAQIKNTLLVNTSETVEVISNAALAELTDCEIIGGPEPEVTTPEVTTPDETTPEETTPATTTPAETEPAVTTPAATEAPATTGGCGGITVAAQLVAIICAAGALLVIKKK